MSQTAPFADDRLLADCGPVRSFLRRPPGTGDVFVDGEEVKDVTTHPARGNGADNGIIVRYIEDPANAELMTYRTTGAPSTVSAIARLIDALRHGGAIQRWAEESLLLIGRTPDHVAGFFAGYAAAPEILAQNGNEKFAERAVKIYEYLRDNDAYIAYTIVPPQIDRSKPAHQQNPPDLYAGVVEERDNGVIIKGAQMLGTGAVFADYIHLSTIHPLRPGDENHAVSLIVPANAPGVKIYSRRSYAGAAPSIFDYPLASRFDETDSLVEDNVFVPWSTSSSTRISNLQRSMVRNTGAYPRQQSGADPLRHKIEVPDGPR